MPRVFLPHLRPRCTLEGQCICVLCVYTHTYAHASIHTLVYLHCFHCFSLPSLFYSVSVHCSPVIQEHFCAQRRNRRAGRSVDCPCHFALNPPDVRAKAVHRRESVELLRRDPFERRLLDCEARRAQFDAATARPSRSNTCIVGSAAQIRVGADDEAARGEQFAQKCDFLVVTHIKPQTFGQLAKWLAPQKLHLRHTSASRGGWAASTSPQRMITLRLQTPPAN